VNKFKAKLRGSISILALTAIIASSLAGSYYYIDQKADTRAQHTLSKVVDDAKSEGVELTYSSVDASPLLRNITVSDFKILGNSQEPDITLGHISITGFNWHDLNQETDKLPLALSIDIQNAVLHLKPSMVENDADLQALVKTFGSQINFSSHFAYSLNQESGLLSISTTETVVDNFSFNSDLTIGSAAWLAEIDANSEDKPLSELMSTTLNTLSITFNNDGIIEKIRSVAAKKTGQSQEQLTQDSVDQIKQLQQVAQKNWGPLFVPMIDELIKFTIKPQQLHITINPEAPLNGDDFMLAFIGGDAGLLTLIEQAHIQLKAN